MSKQTMGRYVALAVAVPVLLLSAPGAWAFSASFAWCAGSPHFTLQDVRFRDDRPQRAELSSRRRHDRYRGQAEVPCGAFAKGFIGPSPPPGEIHTYEFTVKALGANGTALATTTARRKFPE